MQRAYYYVFMFSTKTVIIWRGALLFLFPLWAWGFLHLHRVHACMMDNGKHKMVWCCCIMKYIGHGMGTVSPSACAMGWQQAAEREWREKHTSRVWCALPCESHGEIWVDWNNYALMWMEMTLFLVIRNKGPLPLVPVTALPLNTVG